MSVIVVTKAMLSRIAVQQHFVRNARQTRIRFREALECARVHASLSFEQEQEHEEE